MLKEQLPTKSGIFLFFFPRIWSFFFISEIYQMITRIIFGYIRTHINHLSLLIVTWTFWTFLIIRLCLIEKNIYIFEVFLPWDKMLHNLTRNASLSSSVSRVIKYSSFSEESKSEKRCGRWVTWSTTLPNYKGNIATWKRESPTKCTFFFASYFSFKAYIYQPR